MTKAGRLHVLNSSEVESDKNGTRPSVTEHFKNGDARVICMRCQNSQTEYSKHEGRFSENRHTDILSDRYSIIDKMDDTCLRSD